ncbi:MAG TPA: type IV pilus assembly protein PilM [Actinomycetota bacterium]|nr:type IV pilus assembly protein PilM [Actinomycetota bacterium]
MARVRVGVDVGSTGVRAAELSVGSDPPFLVRAAQVPLSPGAVVGGEVKQPEAVTEAIKELWRRGGFRSKEVTMGVGNQRVVVREVTVPSIPAKELRQSLPFQVAELIPIPMEDAVLDYDVLEEFDQDEGRMLRLLVVAAQREMVDTLVQTAVAAKLQPVGVDLVPFALVRAVGSTDGLGLEEADAGGEAVVDVGADVTNICVHERGVAKFVRILPSGGHDVTGAMASSLGIPEDQAEAIKRGTPPDGAPAPETARQVLDSRASVLVDEIRSSFDFYQAQSPGARVSRVLVTGGSSKLPGLLQMIGERVRAQVEPGHAFSKVRPQLAMDEETMAEAEPLLAVAVGLALPEVSR